MPKIELLDQQGGTVAVLKKKKVRAVVVRKQPKKQKGVVVKRSRGKGPSSYVDVAARAVSNYVSSGGNIVSTLGGAALDSASVYAQQYLRSARASPAFSAQLVSAPVNLSTINRGTMTGVKNGAVAIRETPGGGMMVHQRNYVGEIFLSIATGTPYLYDPTNVFSTYIGTAATTSAAANYAPVFPVMCGQIGGGSSSTVYKQPYFFPPNTEAAQTGASKEMWRMESMTIDFQSCAPASTQGSLAISYSPRQLAEFAYGGGYPAGAANTFFNMSQDACFLNTPLWQSNTLRIPGSAMRNHGDNGWQRTHMWISSGTGTDQFVEENAQQGCIILNCADVGLGGATAIPVGYLFVDYVISFKGQHARDSVPYGYGSSLPLSVQEQLFAQYVEEQRSALLANPHPSGGRPDTEQKKYLAPLDSEYAQAVLKRARPAKSKIDMAIKPLSLTSSTPSEEIKSRERSVSSGFEVVGM